MYLNATWFNNKQYKTEINLSIMNNGNLSLKKGGIGELI